MHRPSSACYRVAICHLEGLMDWNRREAVASLLASLGVAGLTSCSAGPGGTQQQGGSSGTGGTTDGPVQLE